VGLEQVVGQFGVGPVGPVQALLGRTVDDPALALVGPLGGARAGRPPGLAGPQPVEPALQVGVEPALDRPAVDAQVGGAVLVLAALVGQQDNVDAVAELAVLGGTECRFEPLDVSRG
jgi:hypothetical protein